MQITTWQRISCLTLTLTSSFVCYFFGPGPLRGQKSVSGDVFGHTDSIESLLKNICRGSKTRLFSKGVGPGIWVKNDQIFKSAFFTCLRPQGSQRAVKLPWDSFLSANNALTKNFLFNPFSFVGYFFVPGPLGGLKSVSGDVFGHSHLIGSRIFVVGPKIYFFVRGRSRVFGPKSSGDAARFAPQDPSIHSINLSHTILTPICIRSAFFL